MATATKIDNPVLTSDFPDTLQNKHDVRRHARQPHAFVRNVTQMK